MSSNPSSTHKNKNKINKILPPPEKGGRQR
jgi:hypothetical protein